MAQVAADVRTEQRLMRQRQAESREIERCMERMLSQVAAKEHMIDYEVRLVSLTLLLPTDAVAPCNRLQAMQPCMVVAFCVCLPSSLLTSTSHAYSRQELICSVIDPVPA